MGIFCTTCPFMVNLSKVYSVNSIFCVHVICYNFLCSHHMLNHILTTLAGSIQPGRLNCDALVCDSVYHMNTALVLELLQIQCHQRKWNYDPQRHQFWLFLYVWLYSLKFSDTLWFSIFYWNLPTLAYN